MEQRQVFDSSPRYPQGQGFIADTNINSQGKVTFPALLEIVTSPSSSGCLKTSKADLLNSGNSSTGMSIGAGDGGPEPGGLATYEVAANAFAGQWRADALKLIIHITDNYAGGDDDVANSADQTYFQNTLSN